MMPDPTSSASASLTVLAVMVFGPFAGPYALIVFAALAGALWPLSASDTATKKAGAWLLLRCTLTAIVLTFFIVAVLEKFWSIHPDEMIAPVAFMIGALGNGWRSVAKAFGDAVGSFFERRGP